MMRFLFRRAAILVPTLIGITLVAFCLIRLVPGDPVLLIIGERSTTPEAYSSMRAVLGLDQPITTQYFHYVLRAMHGDLGQSVVSKLPVWGEFIARFPATFELGATALFWAIVFGIPLGIVAAVRRNSLLDYTVVTTALVGYSMPIFWWGLMLILFFSVHLGWTPVSGRLAVEYEIPTRTGLLLIDAWFSETPWPAFKSAFSHLVLPSIALGTIPLAIVTRMTRSAMLEVLGEDYVRTAKAKGLTRRAVIGRHALRNALIPVVTVIGLQFGGVLTGAILTETIFSWPGIGKWLVNSVMARDYPVIQGGILLIAVLVVAVNLGVDVVYAIINPRIR